MLALQRGWQRITALFSSRAVEASALLLARLALAGVFWRSGRAKIEEGSWFSISDATYYLFREEYTRVPLPPEFAAVAAAAAEHVLPVLLVIGLGVRLSALGLLGMTMVIQLFVYPEAWWPVHSLWAALALVLIARGGGALALDALFSRFAR
ncbi:DoxX family protein [Sphingosinicella sp.]|uniref:DoxX family protein n=1 Tax=Sphingosinicella sp. TaxID=1917971 RepID=UPI00181112B8|nr:DoxX family protein [Sphingosinicella sp.]MBA4759471.1 DoxX family protein [Sphingosinicella sp.]